jgi:Putative cyclase
VDERSTRTAARTPLNFRLDARLKLGSEDPQMCNACTPSIGAENGSPSDYTLPAPPGGYNGNAYTTEQWWPSRYGADDLLGAGNELTSERTLEALRMVTEGRIVELARVLEMGAPTFGQSRLFHQVTLAHGTLEQTLFGMNGNRVNYFEEQVTQIYHIGTHLDGFGHVGIDGVHYNGHRYGDFYTPTGVTKFGMESVRPWLSRGVFLDVAAVVGVEMLDEGFVITPDHLEQACQAQRRRDPPGRRSHLPYRIWIPVDGRQR